MISEVTSGRYHIKWTRLANLPAPMYNAYVTVQDKRIYVAGGFSQVVGAMHEVYVYNISIDQWGQLPSSGHFFGIPHVIGDKLAIIGGALSATKMPTNKVSTFDEASQTWTSYYPDLLSVRSRPGVVTHLEHIIVAGGGKYVADKPVVQDDIEVLNWIQNSHWRKASINLPVPMCAFTPIIAGDQLFIVGYAGSDKKRENQAYKLPISIITQLVNIKQQSHDVSSTWIKMTDADQWFTALIPNSFPPVVVGGCDQAGVPTADIKMYDSSCHSWRIIASLSSVRSRETIGAVNNNAIVVIGGCEANSKLSSLTTVELGQAELISL